MKVNELKNIIKNYKEIDKDKIIIELYKRIPKSVKENYDIDNFITNINNSVKKIENDISYSELKKEVEYFCECVWNELYCSPNKTIPKNERSKWRFKVKKYYKALVTIPHLTEEGMDALNLLKDLYKILSHGSNYLLFTNWNTFGAVGISQSDFLRVIVDKKIEEGKTEDSIRYCIDLLEYEYDPQDYHLNLLIVIEDIFKTDKEKNIGISILEEKILEYKTKYETIRQYSIKSKLNYFVECAFDIYLNFNDVKNGIKLFNKHYCEDNKEVKEYILLDILNRHSLDKEWLEEYESNIGKIDYRDSLKEEYKNRKKEYEG